jgi:hypothetical protein
VAVRESASYSKWMAGTPSTNRKYENYEFTSGQRLKSAPNPTYHPTLGKSTKLMNTVLRKLEIIVSVERT